MVQTGQEGPLIITVKLRLYIVYRKLFYLVECSPERQDKETNKKKPVV